MNIKHERLAAWIKDIEELCAPDQVYLCNGSQKEHDLICEELVSIGVFIPLAKRPKSFLCRSDPQDVARVEDCTFICSVKKEDAGPSNKWEDPKKMKAILTDLFKGCMKGRKMYVIPFSMGPIGSELSEIGVQITDSEYVVANTFIMTRMGTKALDELGTDKEFVP